MVDVSSLEITALIAQRKPFIMVDKLLRVEGEEVETAFSVRADNYFLVNGSMVATGLIENMAQSASAMAGYEALQSGEKPVAAFLVEVRKFSCTRLPAVGDTLHTTVVRTLNLYGFTYFTGRVLLNDEEIARTQMKIFNNTQIEE